MEQMRREAGNFGFEYRMLDHDEVAALLPGVGPSVAARRGRLKTGTPIR
jgi:hypothetical protein